MQIDDHPHLKLLYLQESAVAAAAVFKRSAPVLPLSLLQVLQVPQRKKKGRKRKALFNQGGINVPRPFAQFITIMFFPIQ